MELRLQQTQADLLRRILDVWIREKKQEIADTDDFDYRTRLKADRDLAISILQQIDPRQAGAYRTAS